MSPDMEYIVDQAKAVLAIDSPTSYTKAAASYVLEEYRRLGFRPEMTAKGGVLVCLNPEARRRTACCSWPTWTLWGPWWRKSVETAACG